MLYFIINNNFSKIRLVFNHSSKLLKNQTRCIYSTGADLHGLKKFREKVKDEDNIVEKVVYNSVIKHVSRITPKKNESEMETKIERPPVLALKYFSNEYSNVTKPIKEENSSIDVENETNEINFPYGRHHQIALDIDESTKDEKNIFDDNLIEHEDSSFDIIKDTYCRRPSKNWMDDYNKYIEIPGKENERDQDEEDENEINFSTNYGSADPNVPPSTVPCGGCGAHLHCQDSAIPGYLPKEIFVGLNEKQLRALVCQRCHFLREYNTALSVSVNPVIYPQLLSKIKNEKALVILVVDMTDFPCSIWPGILEIIGPKRPLIVVGNKIDLLQDWSKGWLERAKESLIKQLPPQANLLHVTLVSAKTGFGIEELITSLYNIWEYRGDVYLVGCTNVGKSTLFNTLLNSDYCKSKAVDLVQRATTAPWPGTTLNLLKFPIMRPQAARLATRTLRLRVQRSQNRTETTPQIISRIDRTFAVGNVERFTDPYEEDPFAVPKMKVLRNISSPGSGLDPSDPLYAKGKWLYDTPGVVTSDQIIDLLTTEELVQTLPRQPITPRTYQVWPGQSLLIAGLGRLDYISGPVNIKMTVLAAFNLPVTICYIADTEDVYHHYLGSEALAVPCGGEQRLKNWPGLEAAEPFVLKGDGWSESCADVVLSSAGWIAVTAQKDSLCNLQAWTPSARGIHVRVPPVLPRAISLKGCKMWGTQAYALFSKSKKPKNT